MLRPIVEVAAELGLAPEHLVSYGPHIAKIGLPALDEDFGRATLRALATQEEALYGHDAWVGYTSLMDLFLAEIQLRG